MFGSTGYSSLLPDFYGKLESNIKVKQNYGSVSANTLTFLNISDIKNQARYLYPITIDPNGVNHDNIATTIRTDFKISKNN